MSFDFRVEGSPVYFQVVCAEQHEDNLVLAVFFFEKLVHRCEHYLACIRLLNRLHKITSDEGIIIASSNDPYATSDPAHLEYHRKNKLKGRLGGQTKIRIRYANYATPWFDYLRVSRQEMKTLVDGTKWEVERFIDSDGSGYCAIIKKRP